MNSCYRLWEVHTAGIDVRTRHFDRGNGPRNVKRKCGQMADLFDIVAAD